jgi:hypothetical protein
MMLLEEAEKAAAAREDAVAKVTRSTPWKGGTYIKRKNCRRRT